MAASSILYDLFRCLYFGNRNLILHNVFSFITNFEVVMEIM